MASSYYQGVIWTNHALARLEERRLSQHIAADAFIHADYTEKGKNGTIEYHKQHGNSHITVLAKQNERAEWIIISVWVDPPLPGTSDARKKEAYKKYQKASFWGKFFIEIKQMLLGREF